jgi:hypothetical protein
MFVAALAPSALSQPGGFGLPRFAVLTAALSQEPGSAALPPEPGSAVGCPAGLTVGVL